jgi:hypothetical protein
MLTRIIDSAVQLMSNKLQNAWHKLGAYFNYFYNVIKDMKLNRLVAFRDAKLVSKFIDLLTKSKEYF